MADTVTAGEVAAFIETLAPPETGVPGDELGIIFGDPATPVRAIAVMWNAHTRSIEAAAALGVNLLMVHERPFFLPIRSEWFDMPQQLEQIAPNRRRRELLEQHGMVIFRAHSNWDALRGDGVPDQAVAALNIDGLTELSRHKFFTVQRLPRPFTVRELGEHARIGLELPFTPRIFGDPRREVETFCLLIGGFGGNQYNLPQVVHGYGAQALIIGEMLEFFVIQALELDMQVIETLHSRSEIPAVKRQADLVRDAFGPRGVPVHYVDSGALGW